MRLWQVAATALQLCEKLLGLLASTLQAASDALRGAKTPSKRRILLFLLIYEGGTTTCVHPSSSGASPRWMSVSRVYKSKQVGPGSVL